MSESSYPNPDVGSRNWKALCKVEDGVPVKIDDSPLSWRTDSGERPTDEYLAWAGYYEFIDAQDPVYDQNTHKLSTPEVSDFIVNSVTKTVTRQKTAVALSSAELEELRSQRLSQIRDIRNQRLADSDWTQAADISESVRTEWATYRQNLRDLILSVGDPLQFNSWPTPPRLGPEGTKPGPEDNDVYSN